MEMMQMQMVFRRDISAPLTVQAPMTLLKEGDSDANALIVELYEGEQPKNADGYTVTGYLVRADGARVPLEGTANENKITVTLNRHCYLVPGPFGAFVRLVKGEFKRTILEIAGRIESEGDGPVVDVDEKYFTIDDVIAQMDEMIRVTEEATEAAHGAEQAAEKAEKWANAEAEAESVAAGSAPSVKVTEEDGKKMIRFGVPAGKTPEIKFTVKTGAPGTSVQIVQGGTPEKPEVELTIPRGDTGAIDGLDYYEGEPEALGEASPGTANGVARGNHVHPMPTAADVGAVAYHETAPVNLLTNSYFAEPVNRRGKTEYSHGKTKDTIDGWKTYAGVKTEDGYIAVTNKGTGPNNLYQYFPLGTFKIGQTYTMAAKFQDGRLLMGSTVCKADSQVNFYYVNSSTTSLGMHQNDNSSGVEDVYICVRGGKTENIVWAALYEGEYTAETLPPYTPKGYSVELADCRRRYPELGATVIRPLVSLKTQDCILIQAGAENILCDTGSTSDADADDSGKPDDPNAPTVLVQKLNDLGVTHIDTVYISHYHSDHAGLPELVAAGLDISGAQLILPQNPVEDKVGNGTYKLYEDIIDLVDDHNLTVTYPAENEKIYIGGDGAYLEFYNTDHDAYYGMADFDYNNCSLCAMLVHGNKKVFFSGDLGLAGQKALIGKVPKVDLYKVEHHGLNAWIDKEFYMTISPDMAFTTSGSGEEAARRKYQPLCKSAAQVYFQENGIPNFCTHDNPDLMFAVMRDSISVKGRSFNSRVTINGRPSLLAAIPYDYSARARNITLMDLIQCMERESYVTTRISDDYALWGLVEGFVGSNASDAIITMYKGSSTAYTSSSDKYTGYIQILPMLKELGNNVPKPIMIAGTFDVSPGDNALAVNLRTVEPVSYHKFTKAKASTTSTFTASDYNGMMYAIESGNIRANFDGVIKYSVTIINDGTTQKELSICRKNAKGGDDTNVVTKLYCGSKTTTSLTNTYTHKEGDEFYVKSEDGDLKDLTIWFIAEGNWSSRVYSDASMTATPMFVNKPYY